jgi:hypothetical protein
MLQAGSSSFRVRDEVDFSIYLILPAVLSPWGRLKPLTEMSTRKFPGGKGGQRVGLTALLPSLSRMSENVGASTSHSPKGLYGLYRDNFTLLFQFWIMFIFYEVILRSRKEISWIHLVHISLKLSRFQFVHTSPYSPRYLANIFTRIVIIMWKSSLRKTSLGWNVLARGTGGEHSCIYSTGKLEIHHSHWPLNFFPFSQCYW